jgi:hypothetical protein
MRTRDYEYGRISDDELPAGFERSKRGNATRKCRYGRVIVFRHPDGSRYADLRRLPPLPNHRPT